MKILLISDFLPPVTGGLESHVAALGRALTLRGDEVRIATLTRNPAPLEGVRIHPLRSAAHYLPHERADRPFAPPVPEPIARGQLRDIVREFQPDVIHGHSWLAASLPAIRIPVVLTAHDYALACQLRTLLHPDGSECSGPALRKCIACGTPAYGRATSTALTFGTKAGRALTQARRVLAVSAAVRDALTPWLDVPVDVVPNFVAPEPPLEPLGPDLPDGGFVLYVGDAGAHKGVPDLLDIWSSRRVPAPLVIATPQPHAIPATANVHVARLTPGQVASAFRSCLLAVVPSRWRDPCPTVVLEALRAGAPLVATRTGGIPELARDGREALLVDPGDVDVLSEAIAQMASDRALRDRFRSQALERAPEFGVRPVSERIRAAYVETIADCSGAAA